MKKYNCLIMNNEVWLLEARLEYDLKYFDFIILAEANSTFSGLSKPFFYEKYKDIFKKYEDRILYVKLENLPKPYKGNFLGHNNFKAKENRWIVEFYHRNYLQNAILQIAKEGDLICTQDIDEIQNIDSLNKIDNLNCINYLSYYDFRFTILDDPLSNSWHKGFVTSFENLQKINIHDYRNINKHDDYFYLSHITPADFRFDDQDQNHMVYNSYRAPIQDISIIYSPIGWHVSSMSCHSDNNTKVKCFAHQEFANTFDKIIDFDLEKTTEDIVNKFIDKDDKNEIHALAPQFLQNSRFTSLFKQHLKE